MISWSRVSKYNPFLKYNWQCFLFSGQFPSDDERKDTRATEICEEVFNWHTCSSLYLWFISFQSPVDGDSAFRLSAVVEDEVALESIKYQKHSYRL